MTNDFAHSAAPITGGIGGLGYQPGPTVGLGDFMVQGGGYPAAAQTILQGSAGAQSQLVQAYHSLYQQKAEGIASGQGEATNRLLASGASQGYSPDLIRQMQAGSNAQAQGAIGEAAGAAGYGLHNDLASLTKGTATELAGLKDSEIHDLFQAYLAKKGLKMQQEAMGVGLLGDVIGGAATAASSGGAKTG